LIPGTTSLAEVAEARQVVDEVLSGAMSASEIGGQRGLFVASDSASLSLSSPQGLPACSPFFFFPPPIRWCTFAV